MPYGTIVATVLTAQGGYMSVHRRVGVSHSNGRDEAWVVPDLGASVMELLVPKSQALMKLCLSLRDVERLNRSNRARLHADGMRYVVDLVLHQQRISVQARRVLATLQLEFDMNDPVVVAVLRAIAEERTREERWELVGALLRRRMISGDFADALLP